MANQLLTLSMITKQAVRLWRNTNAFLMHLDRQYDSEWSDSGAKIGATLRIRYPNDFTVRRGPIAEVQDTNELQTTLVLADQVGTDMSYSSTDLRLSLQDYSKRVLAPAVNVVAGDIATQVMQGSENGGASNWAANITGGVLSTPNQSTILKARAALVNASAPASIRRFVTSPDSNASIVAGLTTLYNPEKEISKQYMSGEMGSALGFQFMEDQTVITHTNGTLAQGSATVNGAGQSGQQLVVNALAGSLNAGDIITIAGAYAVNRITKASLGKLLTFAVTASVPAGSTVIPIYPAMIGPSASGSQVQYQTVSALPANGAAVNPVGGLPAGATYVKNLAFVPEAITLATADLPLPKGVHDAAREQYDGISMRMVTAFNIGTDQYITRLDVLFGVAYLRPEWVVVVPDVVQVD